MQQKYWWKLQKGTGIKVQIPDDIDKETGKQKYRPAIVIKSYPSHVKVQLMTTESSSHDYFKIKIDNQIQYIRPIYLTLMFHCLALLWFCKTLSNKTLSMLLLLISIFNSPSTVSNSFLTVDDIKVVGLDKLDNILQNEKKKTENNLCRACYYINKHSKKIKNNDKINM